MWGSNSQPQIKSPMLYLLSQPGAPKRVLIKFTYIGNAINAIMYIHIKLTTPQYRTFPCLQKVPSHLVPVSLSHPSQATIFFSLFFHIRLVLPLLELNILKWSYIQCISDSKLYIIAFAFL